MFLFIFGEHHEADRDCGQNRRKRHWLEQLNKKAAAIDRRQTQKPSCRRRTDVRAHDDRNRLRETHDTGIHKPDQHHRRCRRALNDCRYRASQQNPSGYTGSQASQYFFQLITRSFGQTVTHRFHTEQKQTESAKHLQHSKNVHKHAPFSLCILLFLHSSFIVKAGCQK